MFNIRLRKVILFVLVFVTVLQPMTLCHAAYGSKKKVTFKYVSKRKPIKKVKIKNKVTSISKNKKARGTTQTTTSQKAIILVNRILQTGKKYLGTPYKLGARVGQTQTFDCSLFTQTVFKENGIKLPRSSRQQATCGKTVSLSQLQKGDLVFFVSRGSNRIGHVAIYAGNNTILHTYGKGGVRYDSLDTTWLKTTLVSAKRVI